jgi:hypothetical protein
MTEPSASAREGRLKRASDELSALRLQLVQLIIQQGNIFSNWVKFAITVQGGLAAGLGAVLLSGLAKYRLLGLIIAFFGIATAALFAKILVRHVQWAHWYISRGKELASAREIFPPDNAIPELKLKELVALRWKELGQQKWEEVLPLKWKQLGPVIRPILIFLLLVAIAWGVVLVWLLFQDSEALPPNPNFKTWNNCPPNYTVQGEMCKPYRGP